MLHQDPRLPVVRALLAGAQEIEPRTAVTMALARHMVVQRPLQVGVLRLGTLELEHHMIQVLASARLQINLSTPSPLALELLCHPPMAPLHLVMALGVDLVHRLGVLALLSPLL